MAPYSNTVPDQFIANLLDDRVIVTSLKCTTGQKNFAAVGHLGRSLLGPKEGTGRRTELIELAVDGMGVAQVIPALVGSLQSFPSIQRLTLSSLRVGELTGTMASPVTFPVLRMLLLERVTAAFLCLAASINAPTLHTFGVRCTGKGDGPDFALVHAFSSAKVVILHGAEYLYDARGFQLEVAEVFPNASTIQATFGSYNGFMNRIITAPPNLQTLQVQGAATTLFDLVQILKDQTRNLQNVVLFDQTGMVSSRTFWDSDPGLLAENTSWGTMDMFSFWNTVESLAPRSL